MQTKIDVNEACGKVENYFSQTELKTPASSFDGMKNIKFRLMVDETVSEDEANRKKQKGQSDWEQPWPCKRLGQ